MEGRMRRQQVVQPVPSILLLPDTFISPFLVEVFASGLGLPVA